MSNKNLFFPFRISVKQLKMDLELKKLEKAISGLEKPTIKKDVKSRMKKDILMKMKSQKKTVLPASLLSLAKAVKRISSKTNPSLNLKAKLKERVIGVAENTPFKFSFNLQKTVASFLIFLLAFSAVGIYSVDIPIAKAAKKTSFQEVIGDVYFIRDGQMFPAQENMELMQGDIVVTEGNALAKIRYIDDSVTRLSPLTQITINKLFQDEEDRAKTEVQIKLDQGRIWSQVINLVDDDSLFKILTKEIETSSKNKASFDIEAKDEENVRVSVFDNKVSVKLEKDEKEDGKYLLEGYSLEVNADNPNVKKVTLKDELEEDDLWVQMNKAEDKKYLIAYEEEAANENKKAAGVLPEDPLYTVKKINEGTKLLVTTDEIEKAKLKLDIAIKRLNEASALLSEGKTETAQQTIEEFNSIVDEISILVTNSADLQIFAKNLLNEKAKNLSVVLPDSPLYPAKEALRDTKVKFAITYIEKEIVAKENASEKLSEAKTLIKDDKNDIAAETLSSDEVLKEAVEEKSSTSSRELKQIVETVEDELDQVEPEEELTEVKTEIIFEEDDPDAESDTAVIMSVSQEEQESDPASQK